MRLILTLLFTIASLAISLMLIRFLFENFIISRVLCLVCGLIVMIDAFSGIPENQIWNAVFVTVLSWLFFRGENSVDTYETGWIIFDDFGNETIETFGGLLFHAILPTILIGGLYFYFGIESSFIFFVIPGIIILLDIFSFFHEF